MEKEYFYLLIIFITVISLFPNLIFADGGLIHWPPTIYLDQSAQNTIVGWNGKEEIIILSIDIKSSGSSTVLRILPLPSNPTEIKEGSFDSFEKLVKIMNEKINLIREEWQRLGKGTEVPSGIEITFQKKIGAHDITVVKVNNLDYFLNWVKDFANRKGLEVKEISFGFKEGIKNYLKRDIKYFVFDVIEIGKEKESVKPLIYKFDSGFLYFPILISGASEISESLTGIKIFLITEEGIPINYWHPYWQGVFGYPVELNQEELKEVSEEVSKLFGSTVKVTTFDYYGFLRDFKKDLIFFPKIWRRHLRIGSYGEDVKVLQKFLINGGYWDSEIEATGYFGSITKNALIKFQEELKNEILKPYGLEKGTGFFGPKTKTVLEKISL